MFQVGDTIRHNSCGCEGEILAISGLVYSGRITHMGQFCAVRVGASFDWSVVDLFAYSLTTPSWLKKDAWNLGRLAES